MTDNSKQMRDDMKKWGEEFKGCNPKIGWAAVGLLIMIIRIGISVLEKMEQRSDEIPQIK